MEGPVSTGYVVTGLRWATKRMGWLLLTTGAPEFTQSLRASLALVGDDLSGWIIKCIGTDYRK